MHKLTVSGITYPVEVVEGPAFANGRKFDVVCDFEAGIVLISDRVPPSRFREVLNSAAVAIADEMGLTGSLIRVVGSVA